MVRPSTRRQAVIPLQNVHRLLRNAVGRLQPSLRATTPGMGMKLLNRQLIVSQVENTASDVELTAYALKRSGIPHSVHVVIDEEQAMRFLTRGAGKLVRCEAHGFCVIHDRRPID
jgi:hypothetical protein